MMGAEARAQPIQRLTTLAGSAITSSELSSRQPAKAHSAPPLLPVRSSAKPISELLTSPAIFASEQASAKPVAAAVPRKKVAGRLKIPVPRR